MTPLRLLLLPGAFTVCRLDPDEHLPDWAAGPFLSVTRTPSEMSVVCRSDRVPPEVKGEDGWRCLQADTELELSSIGVIASIVDPLAAVSVPCFVLSTYDTDYILVRGVREAAKALREAGHEVAGDLD